MRCTGFQFSSVPQSRPALCNPMRAARQASLSLLKLMSIESVMPSNHLILCCPLLLLPSIFPSIRLFSSESALRIRWPKYWRFSFSISLSNEYSGLISFRIDPKPSQTQSCRPGLGLRGFKMAVGPSLALCPPLSPGLRSNSCPLTWWCYLTISSSVALFSFASIFRSFRVFFSELTLHIRWLKYWNFSFSISLSNEYSGFISFRIDWFDLAVQGTLKSLLQNHN